MKLLEYIERINLMHKLIKEQRTGNPSKFAKKLGISTARLYQLIEELKIMQAPICYSKKDTTYYYSYNYEISAHLKFRPLNNDEMGEISAGHQFKHSRLNIFPKL